MKYPYKNVTLSELRNLAPEIPIESSSETTLEALLFTLGIDITKRFEQLSGLLRDPQYPSKVETQVYWQGIERSDKAWRESGFASDELIDLFRGEINKSDKVKSKATLWGEVEKATNYK